VIGNRAVDQFEVMLDIVFDCSDAAIDLSYSNLEFHRCEWVNRPRLTRG
jgi:hypothetical protein